MITLTSPAFATGERIPKRHTPDGQDTSPPLTWDGVPEDTQEFALLCEDPDTPPAPCVRWIVFRIPRDRRSLAEAGAGGGAVGRNSFGRPTYNGPMPPEDDGPHHCHFRIYALDKPLALARGATRDELLEAIDGHILDTGELVATYGR